MHVRQHREHFGRTPCPQTHQSPIPMENRTDSQQPFLSLSFIFHHFQNSVSRYEESYFLLLYRIHQFFLGPTSEIKKIKKIIKSRGIGNKPVFTKQIYSIRFFFPTNCLGIGNLDSSQMTDFSRIVQFYTFN